MSTTSPYVQVLHKQLARPIRYRWITRVFDRGIGRQDGDAGLVHTATDCEQPSASLRRLRADLTERCELERLSATRIAAVLIDSRRQTAREITTLTEEADSVRQHIDQLSDTQSAELNRVAETEAHLPEAVVRARREREVAAGLAFHQARLDRVDERVRARRAHLAEIDAKLQTLFEGLQSRTFALAEYFERRASNQSRSYLLRVPADGEGHPLNTRTKLTAPAWAHGLNPWLQADPTAAQA